MPKRKPMLYSALLLTAVNLLLRLLGTSFQVYLSGRIGAEGMGLVHLVLSVTSLSLTLGIAGVRTASMYLTASELGRKRSGQLGHILSACCLYSALCSCGVSVLLYLLAPTLAQHWLGAPQVSPAIRLFSFFLPFFCLDAVMSGYYTAAGKIRLLSVIQVAEQLVAIAVTCLALNTCVCTSGAAGCVVLGSGVAGCLSFMLMLLLHRFERNPWQKPEPIGKRLLSIAVPLAAADDLKAGINTAENLMVPRRLALHTGTASAMGLYGTICAMVFPVLMLPAAIVYALAELLIPEMARCHAAGNTLRIRYLSRQSLKMVLLYSSFCAGILFLLAKPLCLRLYGSKEAGFLLTNYALLCPMLYCDSIVDAINKGLGQQKIAVRYNLLTAILDVIFLFILLPKYAMKGYFFSFALTHGINFLLSLGLLARTAGLRLRLRFPILVLLSAAICLLLSAPLWGSIPGAAVFCAAFFTMLLLTGALDREQLKWLSALLRS